ncbi:dihydrodipicolinate synthase family protein [Variovorax sp. VNK109]|uniref:dihydrodipicolinate synthase family protein n=1 Tax=Variovorax sp. VNK109 TaxID=3400919 RepID=UPI003BFB59E5
MTTPPSLAGTFLFSVTPTRDTGEIDLGAFGRLLDHAIGQGIHGVAVFGSTGMIGSFTEEERRDVIRFAVEHVDGRVPVMAGTSAVTTAEAVRLSQYAEKVGADALLVVPFTYWIPSDDELFGHYRAIAESVQLPVVAYNSPRLTVVDMSSAFLARLSTLGNLRRMKESSPDLSRIPALRRLSGGKMAVATGRDANALDAFMLGADAWYAGISNVIPHHASKLYELACIRRDIPAARALFEEIQPLCAFGMERGLVRVAYSGLAMQGLPVGRPRAPISMLSDADAARLKELLQRLGLV